MIVISIMPGYRGGLGEQIPKLYGKFCWKMSISDQWLTWICVPINSLAIWTCGKVDGGVVDGIVLMRLITT